MDNSQIGFLSVIALVIVLALIGGALVFAPHLLVLVMTIASLTYIAGTVLFTIGH